MTAPLPRYSLRRDTDTVTVIVPELAKLIGLNESIVLMQIGFLAISRDFSKVINGVWWTYGSIRTLQQSYFPYWGISTLNRAINKLVDQKLVIVTDAHNKHGYDRTRWFTLNLTEVAKLSALTLTDKEGKPYPLETWATLIQNETTLFQDETPPIQNETPSSEDLIQNGSTIQETLETQEHREKELESVESRGRVRVRAHDLKHTHTQHTANLRALKRMAKTNALVDSLALEESPDMAATAQETLDQPTAPLIPNSAPPLLPVPRTGTRVPLSAEDEDRLAAGKARICAGACERLLDIEMFRKNGSSHLYRECRDCGKWHPESPYQQSLKRQREERQNPHPRNVVHTFGAAGAQSKAQTDMTHVAAHPLWLAFRDEWKTLSGGQIELSIDKPTRYRQTVDALDAKTVTADEVRGLAREKWAAGKGDYDFAWMKGDIDRYRGKQLSAKGSAASGGAGQGNTLDRHDLTTLEGCDAALADTALTAFDRRVVEDAKAKLVRVASLPLDPPEDYYPPVMWDDKDPEAARRAMWKQQRTMSKAHKAMTREESLRIAGKPEGVQA